MWIVKKQYFEFHISGSSCSTLVLAAYLLELVIALHGDIKHENSSTARENLSSLTQEDPVPSRQIDNYVKL
jgi:hypothetical protein